MLAGNKVIITVAINGGMQQDRDGAVIPKQPAEIGAAAARCYEAGAALVHVHALKRTPRLFEGRAERGGQERFPVVGRNDHGDAHCAIGLFFSQT